MRLIIIRNRDNEKLTQNYCDFVPPGGTIGRGMDNTLVLPDSTRSISRLQATVDISATGETFITCNGSYLPLILNGSELRYNTQYPLSNGDVLNIGGYQFNVEIETLAASLHLPLTEKEGSPSTHDINDAVWDALEAEFSLKPSHMDILENDSLDHPLFMGAAEPTEPIDPLAQLKEASLDSLYEKKAIPDSLFQQDDLFSQPTIMKDTTPSVLKAPQKETAVNGNSINHSPNITEPASDSSSPENDLWPLDSGLLGEGGDNGDDSSDLADLFKNNAVPLTSTLDSLTSQPLENTLWPTEPAPENLSENIKQPFEETEHHINQDTYFSKQIEEPEILDSYEGAAVFIDDLFKQEKKKQNEESISDLLVERPRIGINPVTHQPTKPRQKAASQEQLQGDLYKAFVAGLGLEDIPVAPHFSPEQLYQAGRLLSLFSQGAVALLSSRHLLKMDMKAEMTMILEEGNNPFKLLPSGKTALMQIFGTPMPGFIDPENAVRDALIDLQAHQLGMIAGLRAIITEMLHDLDPQLIEKKVIEQNSITGKMLFRDGKKSTLWKMFKSQHQKMANNLENDFYSLFGESFFDAYDLEIRQYRASQNNKESS